MADGLPSHVPALSVVVVPAAGNGRKTGVSSVLVSTLRALRNQHPVCSDEIVVPHALSEDVSALEIDFPEVRLLPVAVSFPEGSSERTEELRAAGVAAARGTIIALIEDHVRPDSNWSSSILTAHRSDYAAIGGAVENGIDRLANWAIYFTDLGRYQNPLPAGISSYASLVNVSYKRAALLKIHAVWQKRFNEAIVHEALIAAGCQIALSPEVVVRQYWPDSGLGASMQEFFTWGRNYGSARAQLAPPIKILGYACLSPLIPVALLWRGGLNTMRKGRLRAAWFKALPVSAVLTLAWSLGELAGYRASFATSRGERHTDPIRG